VSILSLAFIPVDQKQKKITSSRERERGRDLVSILSPFICSFQCFHQFSLFLLNNIPINGAGQGGSPVWNEKITFRVEYPGQSDQYKLILKIMDKDTFSTDDFIGQAT
jgi:hypothetical protein